MNPVPIGVFRSRWVGYVFAIVFLGLLSVVCLQKSFVADPYQDVATYFLIIFGGFWIVFILVFINDYTILSIYKDKLVLQLVFLPTSDEILFSEVENVKSKTMAIYAEDNPGSRYLSIAGAHRRSTLQIFMKDGQLLEICLNNYTEREEILAALKETNLYSESGNT